MTAFIICLWRSGLRFLLLYLGPLWKAGLIGAAAFLAWIFTDSFRPPSHLLYNAAG